MLSVMEWRACLIKLQLRPNDISQPIVGLRLGYLQGTMCGFHRFGKSSSFGICGGQSGKNGRIAIIRKLIRPLCQFHSFIAVAQRGL